jgi:large subunit ribosomal protein L35
MPKMKTRKSAAKRFKITGSGKIKHHHTRKGHLLSKKSSSRKRRLSRPSIVDKTVEKRVKRMLNV